LYLSEKNVAHKTAVEILRNRIFGSAGGSGGGQYSADLNHLAVSASYKLYTFCIAPNGL